MPQSGYTSALPADVLLDTGVLSVAGSVMGVSRGGLRFDPGIDLRNLPYDGQKVATKGLDRIIKRSPMFVGTMLQASEADFNRYEPGGATPNITPKAQGLLFATGDYLTNLALAYQTGNDETVTITFADSICVRYELVGNVDGEAEISVEFHARLAQGATPDESAVPYTIVRA